MGVEQGQRGQVDRLGGVLRVDRDGRADRVALAALADANVAEEVSGVVEVRLDLGALEALAPGRLRLLLAFVVRGQLAGALGPALLDALLLGLLVGRRLGLSRRLGGSRLLGLFALDLGVLGRVPVVYDLCGGR